MIITPKPTLQVQLEAIEAQSVVEEAELTRQVKKIKALFRRSKTNKLT